jgi:hypothetical protein
MKTKKPRVVDRPQGYEQLAPCSPCALWFLINCRLVPRAPRGSLSMEFVCGLTMKQHKNIVKQSRKQGCVSLRLTPSF